MNRFRWFSHAFYSVQPGRARPRRAERARNVLSRACDAVIIK
jgi:hypothetical protein